MDHTEKKLRRVNVYQGVIVDVETDMVELPNGAITLREVVRHPGGACVVPVDENGVVTLVRQFRYPSREELLELPAGKLEPGEDPLEAARRELSEETGLEAETWTFLGKMYTSPGISSETLYIYLATELRQGAAHPDPNEFVDVMRLPLSELCAMVERDEVPDAKTALGALRAERRLRD